jgi:hypothetical protein
MPQSTRPDRLLSRRSFLSGAAAVTLLAGGGATWALDRFVVDHVAIDDVEAYESARSARHR